MRAPLAPLPTFAAYVFSAWLVSGCAADDEPIASAPPTPTLTRGEGATNDHAPEPLPAGASKGCSVESRGAGTTAKRSIEVARASRTYHLSLPQGGPGARGPKPAPLVFVFHGAGDEEPLRMREWFAVEAAMHDAVVVYPVALPRTRDGGAGGAVVRWDLMGSEDLDFFEAMVGEISDANCIDTRHVFVTGFSSGGNFSQQLACLRPKSIAAMAVVAGPGPFALPCGDGVPIWMTHDANDTTLAIKDARTSRDFWTKKNGCANDAWKPLPTHPECQENTSCPATAPLVYCETKGVGHAVPKFAAGAIGEFFATAVR